MKYLERLDKKELLEATDSRSGAGIVKTLFDAVDKAETGSPEEDEIELPEIPKEMLDELVERVMGQEEVARSHRAGRRAIKPAVAHPAHTEYQA